MDADTSTVLVAYDNKDNLDLISRRLKQTETPALNTTCRRSMGVWPSTESRSEHFGDHPGVQMSRSANLELLESYDAIIAELEPYIGKLHSHRSPLEVLPTALDWPPAPALPPYDSSRLHAARIMGSYLSHPLPRQDKGWETGAPNPPARKPEPRPPGENTACAICWPDPSTALRKSHHLLEDAEESLLACPSPTPAYN